MRLMRFAFRNLLFHWRGNLAVFLGVVVGTAVLTGALLVGDSLRYSLRLLALQRLGWVDEAIVGSRFFRADIAGALPAARRSAVLLLRATADRPGGGAVRQITLLGVDPGFDCPGLDGDDGVVLGANLARELNVGPGDTVTFRVQKTSNVPQEALLGQRNEALQALPFKVAAVLSDDNPASRFSLQPTPEPPRNAFVPIAALQELLEMPGLANTLLVGRPRKDLLQVFRAKLDLDDWGLRLTTPQDKARALFARYGRPGADKLMPSDWYKGTFQGRQEAKFATTFAWGILDPQHKEPRLPRRVIAREEVEKFFEKRYPYLSLESRQLILEPAFAKAALAAADEVGLRAAPTLVYLCKISAKDKPPIAGIVAALDPKQAPPLGPFLPVGRRSLADDEIGIVGWQGEPSLPELTFGDAVTLIYKPPEHQPGGQPDRSAVFGFGGTVPLSGAADDPDLVPPFPGITDKESTGDWKLPFEDKRDPQWQKDELRKEYGDPIYWSEQRTTPKAYITLAAGQKLWSSRFGDLTSIRLAPKDGGSLDDAAKAFRAALLRRLDPDAGGLVFMPLKADALKASSGGTDFADLFLGFSFFLIVAALLLVGLLFRLNLDRRAAEIGILLAAGYRHSAVRRLLLVEGSVLAILGAAAGIGVALGYSALLVRWLGAIWPGGTLRSLLHPAYTWTSLGIGFGVSLLVSWLTILWALRGLGKVSPRALLAGQTFAENEGVAADRPRWSRYIALGAAVLGGALLIAGSFVKDHEAQASTFFGAGAMLLTAALAGLLAWMRGHHHGIIKGGRFAILRLGIRNAGRHPLRSMLTAGLLASAAFLIVAVESFRRSADVRAGETHSPTGGFALLAESDLPVFEDLDSEKGRDDMRAKLVAHYRKAEAMDEAAAERRADDGLGLVKRVVAFRVRQGDDASCLNLYQPRRPRIFGVPASLIAQDGFVFAEAPPGNSWQALLGAEEPFPAFGEQNTVVWMLKSGVGKLFPVPDEDGKSHDLRIAGLLQDSVFQSGLLISEANFLKLYPHHEGYNFFLIDAAPGKESEVKTVLETALADRGFEVTPTAKRLETYLAVENTYLSTFQALGGLGLLLGSLGLAVVLLRGVWERRGELALLRALGYRRAALGWLVLAENAFLLLAGLASGTIAALLAVAPHLAGNAPGGVPVWNLVALLGLVLVVGLLAGTLAVAATLRAPLIPALRRE